MTGSPANRQHERDRMVEKQISARGVSGARVLNALRAVPRHRFVPKELQRHAYEDHPLRIGCGQTISQPYMVAVMTELLDLRPRDRVLEIGTGSGYQTAVLAELAQEIISVERHAELAQDAQARLTAFGYTNVVVHAGDGTLGWPEKAPYDAILVTAGAPTVPPSLDAQLAEGGRLVCPTGTRDMQQLVKRVRTSEGIRETKSTSCIFVPLVGAEGWPD